MTEKTIKRFEAINVKLRTAKYKKLFTEHYFETKSLVIFIFQGFLEIRSTEGFKMSIYFKKKNDLKHVVTYCDKKYLVNKNAIIGNLLMEIEKEINITYVK